MNTLRVMVIALAMVNFPTWVQAKEIYKWVNECWPNPSSPDYPDPFPGPVASAAAAASMVCYKDGVTTRSGCALESVFNYNASGTVKIGLVSWDYSDTHGNHGHLSGYCVTGTRVNDAPAPFDGVEYFGDEGHGGRPDESCHPVSFARGEKKYRYRDIHAAGAFPLEFSRHYQVRIGRWDGVLLLSPGWQFTGLGKRLHSNGNGDVRIAQPAGELRFLSYNGGVNWSSSNPGYSDSLSRIMDGGAHVGFRLTGGDGSIEEYAVNGLLSKLVTPQGLSHSFSYSLSTGTYPSPIAMQIQDDQTLRVLKVTLASEEQPIKVVLLDYAGQSESGRPSVEYIWDEQDRLTGVVYSDDDSDPNNNPVQAFEYSNETTTLNNGTVLQSKKNFLITGIFDLTRNQFDAGQASWPSNQRYSKVTYDALGRVANSALWNNDTGSLSEDLSFSYNWDLFETTSGGVGGSGGGSDGKHPTTTVTNSKGLSTQYTFSTATDVRSVASTTNDWRLMAVDGAGDVTTGCAATASDRSYDTLGHLDTSTNQDGTAVTKRTRDSQGRITTLQTGLAATLQPQAGSQKVMTDYRSGTVLPTLISFYGWNVSGSTWVMYRTDTFDHDANNNVISRTSTDKLSAPNEVRTWSYTNNYHSGTAVLSSVVVNGPRTDVTDTTTYAYNTAGQLTSVTDAAGLITSYADYNHFGLPQTITDANGTVTTLGYNGRGQLENVNTGGAITGITHWSNGLVKKVTQPDGSWLEYSYNSARQLTSVTNHKGEHIDYTPSLLNGEWTQAVTYNSSNTITLQQKRVFDALGRLWKQQDAAGTDQVVYAYDQSDNLRNIIELGNGTNTLTYDNHNRIVSRTYDGQQRLLSESRCTENSMPAVPYNCGTALATTGYSYGVTGDVATVTDPLGHVTSYTHNGFGELVEEVSPDRGTTKYAYDKAGNLASKTKGFGTADAQTITYGFDALNRLSSIDYPGTDKDVTYSWDETGHGAGKGRLTTVLDESGSTAYSYNNQGNVTSKVQHLPSSGPVLTTLYGYTANGTQLDVLTLPGGQPVQYSRDANQDITALTTNGTTSINGSNNLLTAITRLPFGGTTGWQTNSGGSYLHSSSYTTDGLLGSRSVIDGNANAFTTNYEYDAYRQISAQRMAGHPDNDEVYEYDPLGHLSKVTAEYGRVTYGYDTAGNRTSRLMERQDPTTQAWAELYSESYSYATTGNRLNSIARTRAAAPLRDRSFAYDARGNLKTDTRSTTTGGSTTTQVLDLNYGNSDRLNSVDAH